MRKLVFISILILLFLISCNGYQESSVSKTYIYSLNKAIINGQKSKATWINSPEEIIWHLFPPVSHDSGPKLYQVVNKSKSATDWIVTITEEGAIDDEVLGERRTFHFHTLEGLWTIANIKYEIKRRE